MEKTRAYHAFLIKRAPKTRLKKHAGEEIVEKKAVFDSKRKTVHRIKRPALFFYYAFLYDETAGSVSVKARESAKGRKKIHHKPHHNIEDDLSALDEKAFASSIQAICPASPRSDAMGPSPLSGRSPRTVCPGCGGPRSPLPGPGRPGCASPGRARSVRAVAEAQAGIDPLVERFGGEGPHAVFHGRLRGRQKLWIPQGGQGGQIPLISKSSNAFQRVHCVVQPKKT